ncbi:MAG: alpha/beta hydrolase [Mucilaginibacter sp.]
MNKILYIVLLCTLTQISKAQDNLKPLSIGLTAKIYSSALHEQRFINIYLPEGYNGNDTVRYPVIYIPDGGIAEDFLHIVGLVQYSSQPWVNRIKHCIVVGIQNTNRQRDFTFPVPNLNFLQKTGFKKEDIPVFGRSGHYISFLQNELLPYINRRFKTNSHRTIIGESLAGLLITELYIEHRSLFNDYIIISPSLWWGNEQLISKNCQLKKRFKDKK